MCHLPRLRSSRFDALFDKAPSLVRAWHEASNRMSHSAPTLVDRLTQLLPPQDKGASLRSIGTAAAESQALDAPTATSNGEGTFADLPRSLPKTALAKVRVGHGAVAAQQHSSACIKPCLPCPLQIYVRTLYSHQPPHSQAYACIRGLLGEVDGHVRDWLQYQALWDMSPQAAHDKLGDEVEVGPYGGDGVSCLPRERRARVCVCARVCVGVRMPSCALERGLSLYAYQAAPSFFQSTHRNPTPPQT